MVDLVTIDNLSIILFVLFVYSSVFDSFVNRFFFLKNVLLPLSFMLFSSIEIQRCSLLNLKKQLKDILTNSTNFLITLSVFHQLAVNLRGLGTLKTLRIKTCEFWNISVLYRIRQITAVTLEPSESEDVLLDPDMLSSISFYVPLLLALKET